MKNLSITLLLVLSFPLFSQEPVGTIPFEIQNGHIYVQVSIDGSRPLSMAFDTGARANLLHEDVASQLDFAITGSQQVSGASGMTQIQASANHEIGLGELKARGEAFLLMNLDHLGDEEHPLDGVIGGTLLDRYITEINFDASEIRFYNKSDFELPKDFQSIEFSLRPFRIPVITGQLNLANGMKLQGPYLIDTGAALSLRINSPLVRQEALEQQVLPNYPYTTNALSSASTDYVGRLPGFELLGHEFQGFPIRMATGKGGVSGSTSVNGIIGLEILKRFNLIFDYADQVMYYQPSQLYDAAFRENFSGLKLIPVDGMLEIEAIVENSPASEAGLLVGDKIKTVDGQRNFSRTTFSDYVHPLRKDVKLEVIREDKTILVSLKPRKII
ncbi:aspartyl protease family protein [Roseivirga sp.]|uniref:aspartyl protease family protein n=1 Tax=Roseivirga sp. TaxID=1964215 RepID=UPI003B52BB5D